MPDRRRSLPRAGIGCLGLLMALSFVASVSATSLRREEPSVSTNAPPPTPTVGLGWVGHPPAVSNITGDPTGASNPSGSVEEGSSDSNGFTTVIAPTSVCDAQGLVCNVGDFCQCLLYTGTAWDGLGPFYQGTVTFILNADLSTIFNNGSLQCFNSSGVIINALPNGDSVTLDTGGQGCNVGNFGTGNPTFATYNGGFALVSGVGDYFNAFGGGVVGFDIDVSTLSSQLFWRGALGNVL